MTRPPLSPLPGRAAWQHTDDRQGTEVLLASSTPAGHRLAGHTTAVEDGVTWSVGYVVDTDEAWRTLTADVSALAPDGARHLRLERRDDDTWLVDGERRAELDGCVDVDLASSAVTNTLPLHRLPLEAGQVTSVPAAFVRPDLAVHRLEQTYEYLEPGRFAYTSTTFDFACEIRFDASGLVVDYPGIAHRIL